MPLERDNRRVLLAASPSEAPFLKGLFALPELAGWRVFDADTLDRAHFILQHDAFDAVVLDESLGHQGDHELEMVVCQKTTPAVLLMTPTIGLLAAALELGAPLWLPRTMAVNHPRLIAAALDQATRRSEQALRNRQTDEALDQCQRRVGRLLGMLWDNAPVDGRTRWYSQRHMMERLQEELARVARHGGQFSVVLGEVRPRAAVPASSEALLAAWVSEHIHQLKRRCDVLGHYGPNGFLLVLPCTSDKGAAAFCQRLHYALDNSLPRPPMAAGVLLGTAVCGDGRTAAKTILCQAEECLQELRGPADVSLVC